MRTIRPLDAAAVAAVLVMSLLSAVPLLARPENATVVVKTEDDEFRPASWREHGRGISSNGHNLTLGDKGRRGAGDLRRLPRSPLYARKGGQKRRNADLCALKGHDICRGGRG